MYKIIDWYVQRYPFPFKGWKYFYSFLHLLQLDSKRYKKKIADDLHLWVNPSDHIQKEVFWYGHYEKAAIQTLCMLTEEKHIVFDIGANIGYYTVVLAQKASDGALYAFEPVSSTRSQLEDNISLNSLNNVSVYPFCVSNQNTSSVIYISNDSNVGMSSLKEPENFSGKTESVQTISFDTWLETQEISSVDIIKIDIEGAEVLALEGMQQSLSKFRPVILIEVIDEQLKKYGSSVEELYFIISKLSYYAYVPTKTGVLKRLTKNEEGYTIFFLPEEKKFISYIQLLEL